MITVPHGVTASGPFQTARDPIHGNRSQRFSYYLLSPNEAPRGDLIGVTEGKLEWNDNAAIKGGGKITVRQESRGDHDWINLRLKVVMHLDGLEDTPLGVFIPSAPVEQWDNIGLSLDIELLDKCSILANDYVTSTYSLGKGTNVTDAVRTLITSTGESAGSITSGSETLGNSMTWDAGTSKLTIVNDILQAANYFALRTNGIGQFKVHKQTRVGDRPTVFTFIDNGNSVYLPEFTYERDIYSVPNKVVLVSQGSGDKEGMVATATNENPNSPYSYQSRGRWIVDVTTGVEATDQSALNEMARRRLNQLTSPTGTITITHAPLPWIETGSVVKFVRDAADISVRAMVRSTQIDLSPTALQRTEIQEVADL